MKKIIILVIIMFIYSYGIAKQNVVNSINKIMSKNFKTGVITFSICDKKAEPNAVSGDFDGNNILDYAAIVQVVDGYDIVTIWVVFMGEKDGRFDEVILNKQVHKYSSVDEVNEFWSPSINYYLYSVKPGIQKIIDENTGNKIPLRLKIFGIGSGECEAASWLWYWNKKQSKFVMESTSD